MLTADDVLTLTSQNDQPLAAVEEQQPLCITEVRIFFQMTQEAFAKKIGVSVNALARWEVGLAQPSPASRRKLEKTCGLTRSMIYRMFPARPPRRRRAVQAAA